MVVTGKRTVNCGWGGRIEKTGQESLEEGGEAAHRHKEDLREVMEWSETCQQASHFLPCDFIA